MDDRTLLQVIQCKYDGDVVVLQLQLLKMGGRPLMRPQLLCQINLAQTWE